MILRTTKAIGLVFLLSATTWATPSVKTSTDPVPKSVAKSIQSLLADKCYHVTGEGTNSLRFWIRSEVESTAAKAPVGYNTLKEGTILGVLEIKGDGWSDFRGQELSEGVFIIRLIFQPQDGDHMGVAPFPEFVALTPAKEDTEAKPLFHADIVELSTMALDTGHPAILFLQPYFQKPDSKFPSITKNDHEQDVLNVQSQVKLSDGKTADFLFGLIVVGESEEAF